MPFPIALLDPKAFPAVKARRVTLVHFARAVDGFADASAPDVDNRGNVLRAAPGAACGPATGPVIAELAVVVYKPVSIYVKIHRVTINGPASASNPVDAECAYSDDEIAGIIDRMNRIMEPAGMIYVPRATIATEVIDNYTERGTVTLTNVGDQVNVELQTILNKNPDPDSLNVYLFNRFRDATQTAGRDLGVAGIAMSRDQANANPPTTTFPGCQAGFTMCYSTDLEYAAHTAAHEIGHTLRLQHYGGRGAMSKMKNEIWANRNLMRNTVNLAVNSPQRNIGYGTYNNGRVRAGEWLGTKTFPTTANLGQANQIEIARAAAAADSYKPVTR